MKFQTLSSVFLLLINLAIAQAIGQHWENVEIIKTVDLSRSYIHEALQLTIKNTGEEPDNIYLLPFTAEVANSLSALSCMLNDKNVFIDCSLTKQFKELPNGERLLYGAVKLPNKLQPQEETELFIRYSHNLNRYPVPSHIEMLDEQTLVFETESLPLSPYPTSKFTLNVIGSNSIEKLSDEANGKKSSSYSYTTEDVIEPFSFETSKFLYEHNLPLTRAAILNREAWVSHWASTIEFKEDYDLINDAAELASGFSRSKFLMNGLGKKPSHALVAIDVILPEEAHSHYYTDLVGMISTAKVFGSHYILKPRFPIYGGWKFNFTIGWTNPLANFLSVLSDEEFIISVPLLQGPPDIFYDFVNLSIYLPEGAIVEEVQVPVMNFSSETSYERSYFDLGSGHTKVTIEMKNLNEELREGPVFLRYKYSKLELLRKPASIAIYVFIALFSLFLIKQIQLVISA
ncbi:unnamed protein product [Kluyveromyces dobzhanskii CBS 2104]|uniref:Dolichyl-diphosphooligosaccharide--protein glycosyltransferase subunit 1 n=1 Tax=Kluyveromyces dobzhanskii CBS 2104 TaxID=1427455 RepID=A0A0A8L7B1_9SACH|nr:unnamed protein product [Kluyveromyces dobzhanskii CBS 2104]